MDLKRTKYSKPKLSIKTLSLITIFTLLTTFFASCGGINNISNNTSLQTSISSNSAASSNVVSNSPTGSSKLENNSFDEKQFESYLSTLCRFINTPITSTEDMGKLDLFYFLILTAEDYANSLGKTYATDDQSTYVFPLAELLRISKYTLGFEFDLEPYKNNTYFKENGFPSNYYDSSTEEFTVIFAGAFYPVTLDGSKASLIEVLSIDSKENVVTADCRISYAKTLGEIGTEERLAYTFEIIPESNQVFFRLISVTLMK